MKTSPAAVLTRAAQARKTGVFILKIEPTARIFLQGGKVAQVEGVAVLHAVAKGAPTTGNMVQDLMAVCQTGVPFDDAKDAAAEGIGEFIASHAESSAECSFQPGVTPPPGSFPLDHPVTQIVANGFITHRDADMVANSLSEHMARNLLVETLSSDDRTGLGPKVLRVHQLAQGKTLMQLVSKAIPKGPRALEQVWQGLDLLIHLGLLQIEGVNGARKAAEKPERLARKKKVAAEEAERRKVDEEKAVELVQLAAEIEKQRPLTALGVEPDAKLADTMNVQVVDQIFRKIAATYHPDNYPRGPQRDAANKVFAVLNQQRERAQQPDILAEEIDRLSTIGRGKKWVPENNRKQARVLFGQVTRLEEAKRWAEARKKMRRVLKLDDNEALYHVLRIWLDVIAKELEPLAAIAELDQLTLETVADKVEGNYRAGRILRLANKTKPAYVRFQKVLELVPNHVGAAREVRLLERRASQPKR